MINFFGGLTRFFRDTRETFPAGGGRLSFHNKFENESGVCDVPSTSDDENLKRLFDCRGHKCLNANAEPPAAQSTSLATTRKAGGRFIIPSICELHRVYSHEGKLGKCISEKK